MENLSLLSDNELEAGLRKLLCAETETLHDVLVHIREVDARKLYLRKARASLWAYLVKDCRYSPAAAQRRAEAARLTAELPEILPKIREGRLNLFQIGLLQKGVRQKEQECEVPTARKLAILAMLETAHYKEMEAIVARELGLKSLVRTCSRSQADGSVRVSITFRGDAWKKLEKCRDVLSHSIPDGDWARVIERIGEFYLAKRKRERSAASETEVPPRQSRPSRPSRKPPHRAPIPPSLRAFIFARDRHCQWRDPLTQAVCGSTFRLEIDHIKMRSQGGTNAPENLRLLCAGHNQQEARDAGAGPPSPPRAREAAS